MGDNASTWAGVANAGISAYGANQEAKAKNKQIKEANKPQKSFASRTPYMNEYIAQAIPYILQQQQSVFKNRMGKYGLNVPDMPAFTMPTPNYRGVSNGQGAGGAGGSDPFLVGTGIRRV